MSPGFKKQKKNNWKENNQYIDEFYFSRLQKQRISKSTRETPSKENTHNTWVKSSSHQTENRFNNIWLITSKENERLKSINIF